MKLTNATLGGRCANGYERGRGSRVHAVRDESGELERNGYVLAGALCGAKAGSRSVGFCPTIAPVNCPRCLARLSKSQARGE